MFRISIFGFSILVLPLAASARTPNDDYFDEQWYLPQIAAPAAWDTTVGSREVVVAVIDTGIDLDHPDLEAQIWVNDGEVPDDQIDNDGNGYVDDIHGWDFVSDDNDPNPAPDHGLDVDALSHGTIVAGVIGATANNDEGIAGIAWRVRIMPVRILDGLGAGDTELAALGVEYALQNGADIINLSFTGIAFDSRLERAVRDAYRSGVLTVAAVGNEADGGLDLDVYDLFPVCLESPIEDWVLGVAATDEDDRKADFSNYGTDCTDISAPGLGIFGTVFYDPDDDDFAEPYAGYFSGTSVATPQVVGAAALIKAAYPGISAQQLQLALQLSVDPVATRGTEYHGKMGSGRLNVARALEVAGALVGGAAAGTGVEAPGNSSGRIVAARSGSGAPTVISVDASGATVATWDAYAPTFLGGVNLAVGDVDQDSDDDVVVGAGVGGGPQVRIFTQQGELLGQFFAFDETLRSGVRVAVAQQGILTTTKGSAEVRLYDRGGVLIRSLVPFDQALSSDLRVAAGDVDGDGVDEIIVGAGAGRAPWVRVFKADGQLLREFLAYGETFLGGVNLDAGDVDGDGVDEIVTGADLGGGPQVRVFNSVGVAEGQFFAYEETFRGGVRVSVGDRDLDGVDEIITAAGPGGSNVVKIFDSHGNVATSFVAFEESFSGGVNVGIW